ncbi:hypothetical protein EVAR_49574_1 [Eumeta japonica]|uniref:Uncharacterized protein n=1 Tax=Eumeta variegata TaxID=151549 RepID=A0A4C1YPU2_EUMVA|nr:hypothetical protein EVAR_49574_1 [Eumeta japonica]
MMTTPGPTALCAFQGTERVAARFGSLQSQTPLIRHQITLGFPAPARGTYRGLLSVRLRQTYTGGVFVMARAAANLPQRKRTGIAETEIRFFFLGGRARAARPASRAVSPHRGPPDAAPWTRFNLSDYALEEAQSAASPLGVRHARRQSPGRHISPPSMALQRTELDFYPLGGARSDIRWRFSKDFAFEFDLNSRPTRRRHSDLP